MIFKCSAHRKRGINKTSVLKFSHGCHLILYQYRGTETTDPTTNHNALFRFVIICKCGDVLQMKHKAMMQLQDRRVTGVTTTGMVASSGTMTMNK